MSVLDSESFDDQNFIDDDLVTDGDQIVVANAAPKTTKKQALKAAKQPTDAAAKKRVSSKKQKVDINQPKITDAFESNSDTVGAASAEEDSLTDGNSGDFDDKGLKGKTTEKKRKNSVSTKIKASDSTLATRQRVGLKMITKGNARRPKFELNVSVPRLIPEVSDYAMEIRCTTDMAQAIKKLIDNISPLLRTIEFRIYPEGIFICAADLAKYALISVDMAARSFSKYYCRSNERFKITVNISALNNALGHMNGFESLALIFETSSSRELVIQTVKKGRVKTQKLFSIASSDKSFRVPNITYTKPMVLNATDFQQDIRALCFYSSMVTFASNEQELHMMSEGDQGSCHIDLTPDEALLVDPKKKKGAQHAIQYAENQPIGENEANQSDVNQSDANQSEDQGESQVDQDGYAKDPDQDNVQYEGVDEGSNQGHRPIMSRKEERVLFGTSDIDEEAIIQANLLKGEETANMFHGRADEYSELLDGEDHAIGEGEEGAEDIPADEEEAKEESPRKSLVNPKFDPEAYTVGSFILRYFHVICKHENLSQVVEIAPKKNELITIIYPVEPLGGFVKFCVLECQVSDP